MDMHRFPRASLVAVVLLLACGGVWAQSAASGEPDGKLSQAERQKVTEITAQAQQEIRVAQAELDVLRAQLNRLLVNANADMKEAEKLLRQALEWELKIRLAEIRREAEIRKIIGDRRWAESLGAATRAARRAVEPAAQKIEQKVDALTQRIIDLRLTRLNQDEVRKKLRAMLLELMGDDGQAPAPAAP